MVGHNTLILNQAEMVRAIEYYLNAVHFKEPIMVSSVTENKSNLNFAIDLQEKHEKLLDTKEVAAD